MEFKAPMNPGWVPFDFYDFRYRDKKKRVLTSKIYSDIK